MTANDIRAVAYEDSDHETWDSFIESCPMATFLHSRRFLSYHGGKFEDRSLLFYMDGKLAGVLPAATGADSRIISHPGATFGGIVHDGAFRGEKMSQALTAATAYYKKSEANLLTYKAVPPHFRRLPCDDDLFALHAIGARRTTCRLSSVADLSMRSSLSANRRWGAKKARAAGVSGAEGREHAADIWRVLSDNLRERHNATPVHSLEEILFLSDLFPQDIAFHAAMLEGEVAAAVVIFAFPQVWHAQYTASSMKGRKARALDFLFSLLMDLATERGMHWFSFGSSNEHDGTLNQDLYKFKSEFGSSGIVIENYDLTF